MGVDFLMHKGSVSFITLSTIYSAVAEGKEIIPSHLTWMTHSATSIQRVM